LWHGRPALYSAAAAWRPWVGRVSPLVAQRGVQTALGLLTARGASRNDPARGAQFHRCAEPMEDCVLIDHRYYRIKPGMVPAHLDIYEKHGFAAQSRHLGKPFAYLFTESGDVNTLVHMWLYDDVADRAKKRAAMAADPEWQNYLRLNNEAGYVVSQQNNLMLPTRFAPIQR
jgi:NIPSNAP protein